MKTAEALNQLPPKCRQYLETLKTSLKRIEEYHDTAMWKEYRAVARGYIRALVDCGIIEDFKPIWIWFTV